MEEPRIQIPKVVHFIWAGGAKPLSGDDIDTIIDWARRNPTWRINVWVDKETTPHVLQACRENFIQSLANEVDLQARMEQIHIVDISENEYGINFKDSFVRYEIEKFFPCYGASSDLLRYFILFRLGGAYFDTDVFPGTSTLDKIVEDFVQHVLRIDFTSQTTFEGFREEEINAILMQGVIFRAGNDAFVCTQRNPLMMELLQQARFNYCNVRRNRDIQIKAAYGNKNIKDEVVLRTGPGMLKAFLNENMHKEGEVFTCKGSVVKNLRDGKVQLVKPAEINHLGWMAFKFNEYPTPDSHTLVLKRAKMAMQFECENYGVICLDEHISDMITTCPFISEYNVEKMVIAPLLACCAAALAEDPRVRPLLEVTGRYQQTLDFARVQNLSTLYDLTENEQEDALKHLLHGWIPGNVDAALPEFIIKNIESYIRFFHDRIRFFRAILNTYKNNPQTPEFLYNCLASIFEDYRKFALSIEKVYEERGELPATLVRLNEELALILSENENELSGQYKRKCVIF